MSAVGEAVARPIRHEMMRIAGERIDGDTGLRIDVRYPYTNQTIGTVPAGQPRNSGAAEAFDIAAAPQTFPVTRYERQQHIVPHSRADIAQFAA